MAEALASTIDRHFLECVICSEPFTDPRALPCLHSFCCQCLRNWAKSCSKDNSIVKCPLCKKVYKIPEEEGIEGFPVRFLVTNLQDTADKAKQTKPITDLCNKHGKKAKYFCENCGCAACSDCSALDPIHRSHSFARLKEVSQRHSSSLENLTRQVRNVDEKYTTAMQQVQQLKQNLDRDTDAKIQAIDDAKNDFVQQVDNLATAYKQDVYRKKEEHVEVISQIDEQLQIEVASVRCSNVLAINVLASGSHSDVISLYPSLSSSLQQAAQLQPMVLDSKLGQIKLQPQQNNLKNTASLEKLFCDKVQVNVALCSKGTCNQQTTKVGVKPAPAKVANEKHQPSSTTAKPRQPSEDKPVSPSTTAKAHVNKSPASKQNQAKSTSKMKSCQQKRGGSSSRVKSKPSTHSVKKWTEYRQIRPPQNPMGIAIHANGDIALTSMSEPVVVFSRNGNFKLIIRGSPKFIFDIAITPNNQYIIPGNEPYGEDGKNELYIYDSRGVLVSTIPTYDINNQPCRPRSVAVDSTGKIIVGLGYNNHKTVSIHQPDGTLLSKFETIFSPCCITCTPDDQLILLLDNFTVQVMDQLGHNASIIKPPSGIYLGSGWHPHYVCCSKQGQLFVGNRSIHPYKRVFRYVCKGGEYEYVDCTPQMAHDPYGIAVSDDGQELFVVECLTSVVRVFKLN